MTKLIVSPIDPSAPGSYRLRREYRRITRRLNELSETEGSSVAEYCKMLDEADDFIIGRLRTDDGSDVQVVLDQLSANEFDELWRAAGVEGETVPPASASSSSTPSPDSPASPLNG